MAQVNMCHGFRLPGEVAQQPLHTASAAEHNCSDLYWTADGYKHLKGPLRQLSSARMRMPLCTSQQTLSVAHAHICCQIKSTNGVHGVSATVTQNSDWPLE